MSDDQVWNAFISAIPAQDKARHDLENFQARLLKNALQEIEDLKLEIIQHQSRDRAAGRSASRLLEPSA
jgi:hypothetical protein